MLKMKTITLETFEQLDPNPVRETAKTTRRVWRVLKVTDSIEFTPREILVKSQVDELCAAKDWKVTVNSSK